MKNQTTRKYDYHNWANDRIFNHLKELPDAVFDQEIKSVFSSIKEVLIHVYQVDAMWLSVMSGAPFSQTMEVIKEIKVKSQDPDLDEIVKLYSENTDRYKSFFEEQDDLDADIEIEHPRYGKLKTTIADLVLHVVNHGTYHRGNITAMLRQQGHAGVPTDYILYVYEMV